MIPTLLALLIALPSAALCYWLGWRRSAHSLTRTRMIGYRTYSGQLERVLAHHGHEVPASVKQLHPDRGYSPLG